MSKLYINSIYLNNLYCLHIKISNDYDRHHDCDINRDCSNRNINSRCYVDRDSNSNCK